MGKSDKFFAKGKREKAESVSERLVAKVDSSSWIPATLEISPDSKRVACVASVGKDRWFVVVDGEEGKQYDTIGKSTPIFSPDSKRVVYKAGEKGKQFVVVDEEEKKRYDGIVKGTPIFSPDDPDSIRYLALLGSGIYVVEARIK